MDCQSGFNHGRERRASMVKYCSAIGIATLLASPALLPDAGLAQNDDAKNAISFIQQMTDRTKACEQNGIPEQECVCRNRADWQDMLVMMQAMQGDPNVDSANKSVLNEGVSKVQGMLAACR